MEETKNLELGSGQEQEEKSAIDFQLIYSTLILNWKWFVLSLIVCLDSIGILIEVFFPRAFTYRRGI